MKLKPRESYETRALRYRMECDRTDRIRKERELLSHTVELWATFREWYGFRDGYNSDNLTKIEQQQAIREQIGYDEERVEWHQSWRYPLIFATDMILMFARHRGQSPRTAWNEMRRDAYRDVRLAKLVVWLVENAGDFHFPWPHEKA